MLIGALLDAGAPLDVVQEAVSAVGVEPVRLSVGRVERGGIAATRAVVDVATDPAERTWAGVRGLLAAAPLDEAVRSRALDAFARLARAEAAVHGTSVDDVHF